MSATLKEAERVMTICNACRYCEGFCAVFQAMELRRTFTQEDLKYFANLCHNCRGCYYACQYAPPHEFDLNCPRTMGKLRQETYEEFCKPKFFSGLFQKNGWVLTLLTLFCMTLVLIFALQHNGMSALFTSYTGDNAFYKIIPYNWMVYPMMLIAAGIVFVFTQSGIMFWKKTGGSKEVITDPKAHLQAVKDVMRLKYLDGGGHGCNYPDDRFSMIRRWFHHATFYGFGLCLAATTFAAFYGHILHIPSPYPVMSLPVIFGTIGGVMLSFGTAGLLYLKIKMDRVPSTPEAMGMDAGFIVLLSLTAISGLFLLILRATPLMGITLVAHLGLVMALFISMPYGKFVHALYRYLALVRHSAEQAENNDS